MRRILLGLCACLFAGVAWGQDQATGFPPYGSFENGRFDAVNRQNLNLNFSIPLVSLPGRGLDFGSAIVYDSLIWTKGTAWSPVTDANGNPTWGWKTFAGSGKTKYNRLTRYCRTTLEDGSILVETTNFYTGYKYVDQAGTPHPFNVSFYEVPTQCNYPTDPRAGSATDASGYYLDATGPTNPKVTAPNGVQNPGSTAVATDSNGNFVSASAVSSTETDYTDTATHLALRVINGATTTGYHYVDSSNTDRLFTLKFQTLSIKTSFGCPGVVEYNGTANLPYEFDLPNGQKYLFSYELTPGYTDKYTGRLQQVTLPTGGTYQYQYPSQPNGGINCADGTILSLTRTISDGASPAQWQFSRTSGVTTETAPQLAYDTAANQTVFSFDSNGHLTSQQIYQGTASPSNLKRTINTTWAANGTPATQTVILEDSQTQSQTETTFDSNGNLQVLKEHDWGTGSPGGVVRTTNYTYLADTAYTSKNILNRVTRVTGSDSTGAVKSRTDIAYDEANYVNFTCRTGAAQHDDTNYGCSFTVRGNPTSVTTYTDPVTPAGGTTRHGYYDSLGNVVKADVNCCQQEQWVYSATTNYAYPDSVVRGPAGTQLTSSATYDSHTGLVATTTDENIQQTTFSYDLMKRLVDVRRPDGAHLTWSYNDATPPAQSSVTVTTPVQGTNVQKQTTNYDALARPVKTTTADSAQASYSITEAQYDSWGRTYKVSNPHNSTAQYWTEIDSDALGRPVASKLVQADGTVTAGNTTAYSYSGTTATVTDPAGKQRKSQTDGLGRLVSVWEPDVANGNQLTQRTDYIYTVLDGLAQVKAMQGTQAVQTRTYNYDALGRLTSAATPETNNQAVSYQYNSFNLATQRTDVRGVITTYGYDALNRLQQISYNVGTTGVPATPTVNFTYGTSASQNNNGRLLTMTDGVGSETYTYDILGRVTQMQKTISGTQYTINYGYNSASALTSIQYPSGRNVQPSYDAIGRLSTMADTMGSTNTTYASSFGYNPAFQVTGFNYGNAVAASFGYSNDRLQVTSLSYAKTGQTLFGLNYWYKQDSTNCANGTTGNNGQIQCIMDNVNGTRSLKYTYDALYRVTVAQAGPDATPTWKLGFTYDRYGNRTAQSILGGCVAPQTCPTSSVTVDGTTNRITGSPYAYDLNGNMTNDGLNTLTYDGENRAVTSASGGNTSTYTYDGNSLRAKKQVGSGTATVYIFSGTKVIAEYAAGAGVGSPSREYIYSGAQLLATISGTTTTYHHADLLSVRVTTDTSGSVLPNGQQGHYPYGEQWYPAPPQSPATKWQFTSYERDGGQYESGNDYAMMRYHVNRLGRFSSPDPLAGSAGNPQSLNRFAYVRNDLTNLIDPLGLDGYCIGDTCYVDAWGGNGTRVPVRPGGSGGSSWGGGIGGWAGDLPMRLAKGDRSGGNGSAPPPPCIDPSSLNLLQKAQLYAAQAYAQLTGWTVGFGAGIDAGAGVGPKGSSWNVGLGGSGSTLIVADATGNSGIMNSYSGGLAGVNMPSSGSHFGAGVAAGPSVLISPFSINQIKGPSGSISGGGGAVLGAGFNISTSGALTLTFGVGAGAEAGVSAQGGNSPFFPICK